MVCSEILFCPLSSPWPSSASQGSEEFYFFVGGGVRALGKGAGSWKRGPPTPTPIPPDGPCRRVGEGIGHGSYFERGGGRPESRLSAPPLPTPRLHLCRYVTKLRPAIRLGPFCRQTSLAAELDVPKGQPCTGEGRPRGGGAGDASHCKGTCAAQCHNPGVLTRITSHI